MKKENVIVEVNAESDGVNFSTGRKEFANCGILGICKKENNIYVTQGCGSDVMPRYKYDKGFFPNRLPRAEKQALAEWAIGMWKEWAKQ